MPPEIKIPNSAEIDQALREFEAKSGGGNIPKPPTTTRGDDSGIKYETDNLKALQSSIIKQADVPRMVQLVMKFSGGAIKEQKQAEYVLLGITILMFALSFYFFFKGGSNRSPSPQELEQMNNMMNLNG